MRTRSLWPDLYDPSEVELQPLWDCYFELIADEQYSPER